MIHPKIRHTHKQIKVQYFTEEIEVDEGLVELLQLIWSYRIRTLLSCQERKPGWAWIEFPNVNELERFLSIVAEYKEKEFDKSSLYDRICKNSDWPDDWEYEVWPKNLGVIQKEFDGGQFVGKDIIDEHLGFNHIQLEISVQFPIADIQLLVEILRK